MSAVPVDPRGGVDPSEPALAAGAVDVSQKQVRREIWHQLRKTPSFVIGSAIVIFWVACAFIGYRVVPHAPTYQDLLILNQGPSGSHWFGTDQLGRDVFSRVITGVRSVLIVSVLATIMGTILGTILGLFTGYMRGWLDESLSRFVDAILALPTIMIAVLVVAAVGPSTFSVTVCIGFIFTPLIGRTVRTAVIQERELDYITAARLRNESGLYIMFAELLPNVTSPILVEFTVRLGYAIFTTATLSFLGFGIQPPTPDWGADISANYGLVSAGYWWEVLFAALAIASLVIAVNLISDSLEKVLDNQ